MIRFATNLLQLISRVTTIGCLFSLLLSLVMMNVAIAQTDNAQKDIAQKDNEPTKNTQSEKQTEAKSPSPSKNENQVTQKEPNKKPPESVSQQAPPHNATEQNNARENEAIDWGDWAIAPNPQYGVGIQGEIEAQISSLDQSNLLENATGVATTTKGSNNQQGKKLTTKDLKKAMAELEAMEAKVKKEIDDDTEF